MNKAPLSFIVNALLIGVLAFMFILPVSMAHVLTQMTQTGSSVAGVATEGGDFVVLPNFFDFGEHASFTSEQHGNMFKDTLNLTSFKGKLAAYHTLYTIYNKRNNALTLELVLEDLPHPVEGYRMLVASLASADTIHNTTLLAPARVGDIALTVEDSSVGMGVHAVVIDGEMIIVRALEEGKLLVDPLTRSFEQGSSIFRANLVIADGKLVGANMTPITIPSHASATMNIVIIGRNDTETAPITLPLLMQPRM